MPPCKQHLPHLRLLVQAHALKQASTAMKFLAMPFPRLAFEAANEIGPDLLHRAAKIRQRWKKMKNTLILYQKITLL